MGAPDEPLHGLLGRGATYEGDLSFDGRVRVDGLFRGRLRSSGTLEIGTSGRIEGEIDAVVLHLSGRVEGEVRARRLAVLHDGATLVGELRAGSLECHPGARIAGQVRIGEVTLPQALSWKAMGPPPPIDEHSVHDEVEE